MKKNLISTYVKSGGGTASPLTLKIFDNKRGYYASVHDSEGRMVSRQYGHRLERFVMKDFGFTDSNCTKVVPRGKTKSVRSVD